MGAWDILVLSTGNPRAHKIPRFRGGGDFFSKRGWGGSANFVFLWAWGFF